MQCHGPSFADIIIASVATLHIVDPNFIATKGLPAEWKRLDEWYNFRVVPSDKDVHVLITIDEKTYEGGNDGDYHPMSWYHDYDGGRAFYTALVPYRRILFRSIVFKAPAWGHQICHR